MPTAGRTTTGPGPSPPHPSPSGPLTRAGSAIVTAVVKRGRHWTNWQVGRGGVTGSALAAARASASWRRMSTCRDATKWSSAAHGGAIRPCGRRTVATPRASAMWRVTRNCRRNCLSAKRTGRVRRVKQISYHFFVDFSLTAAITDSTPPYISPSAERCLSRNLRRLSIVGAPVLADGHQGRVPGGDWSPTFLQILGRLAGLLPLMASGRN
jgi:hypothetical protein